MAVRAAVAMVGCALSAVVILVLARSDGRALDPADPLARAAAVSSGHAVSPATAAPPGTAVPPRPAAGGVTAGADRAPDRRGAAPVTSAARRGYHLETPVIGYLPAGFDVWVDHAAADHVSLATHAKQAVTALAKLGIRVRWRGYGRPALQPGRVVITEKLAACVSGTRVAATTYWSARTLPSGQAYLVQSRIVACPTVFAHQSGRVRQAIVFHEMGHAVGLAHTNYRYDGHRQIMNATCDGSVDTYQRGDIAGLRRLVANEAAITRALARR